MLASAPRLVLTERRPPKTEEEIEERKNIDQLNRTPLHCFILGNAKVSLKPPPSSKKKPTPPPPEDETKKLNPSVAPCANCQAKRDNKWNKIDAL